MIDFHLVISICILALLLFRLVKKNKIRFFTVDVTKLAKSSEMLDEETFWSLIDKSLKDSKNEDEQEKSLISQIQKLSLTNMIGFRLRTDKLLYDTYSSSMWCASYIMNGGCSDDGFEYFRCWVISKGKDAYYKAKSNPDNLIEVVTQNEKTFEFENFWYVALKAFKNKTGKNLYDYIDYDNFTTREGKYPSIEMSWKEDDIESMKKICPKLGKKFLK